MEIQHLTRSNTTQLILIANNQVPGFDFATVHSYPDQWLNDANGETQFSFLKEWVNQHIEDSQNILKKPVIFAEFGKSYKILGYAFLNERDELYNIIYSGIYSSATRGGAAAGGLFWQLLTEGEDNFRDGYELVLRENPSIADMVSEQSQKLSRLSNKQRARKLAN